MQLHKTYPKVAICFRKSKVLETK